MPVNPTNKDEKNAWYIVRGILFLVAACFLGYGLFFKQPCGTDADFLSCRLTGTWADWVGSIVFLTGLTVMSGIHKGLKHLGNPPNTSAGNVIMFVAMVLGAILFWNL